MTKGCHGQVNQLYDINWGALNHVSCAPQLISCNYYDVCVCVYGTSMLISHLPSTMYHYLNDPIYRSS